MTVGAAFATALLEPFFFAFLSVPGLAPYDRFEAVAVFLLAAIYLVDIAINFHLAYAEPTERRLITDPRKIRIRYLRCGASKGHLNAE